MTTLIHQSIQRDTVRRILQAALHRAGKTHRFTQQDENRWMDHAGSVFELASTEAVRLEVTLSEQENAELEVVDSQRGGPALVHVRRNLGNGWVSSGITPPLNRGGW